VRPSLNGGLGLLRIGDIVWTWLVGSLTIGVFCVGLVLVEGGSLLERWSDHSLSTGTVHCFRSESTSGICLVRSGGEIGVSTMIGIRQMISTGRGGFGSDSLLSASFGLSRARCNLPSSAFAHFGI
jgi:hypothetical protein